MPYYNNRKMRLAPEADNLQALFAEAEILAGSTNQQGQPKMVELIDTIMSIPSCIQVSHFSSHSLSNSLESQDQQSKIDVVNKWIKEHKKYEGSEEIEEINNNKTGQGAASNSSCGSIRSGPRLTVHPRCRKSRGGPTIRPAMLAVKGRRPLPEKISQNRDQIN